MTTDWLGVLLILLLMIGLAIPLGPYIAKVYLGRRTWLDFLGPLERLIFRLSGIDATKELTWQQNLRALVLLNAVFFLWAFIILLVQGAIPFWNPDGIAGMEPTQAFNTAVSFMTNTNLQHYSGETAATYFTQLCVFAFLQFVSAATGMAALAIVFKAVATKQGTELGNFYNLMLKSATRILLPLATVVAIILLFNGTPATFKGAEQTITLQGDTINVARGPVAPMVAIKQLGTNGGGYFGPNSTHPLENPNYLTNIVETVSIIVLPIAMVFAFGYYTERKRMAWVIFGVMLAGFLLLLAPTLYHEAAGNNSLSSLAIDQSAGSMEGKEVRFGAPASALWGVSTTATSNGSVNAMHDSFTPMSGTLLLLGMMINAFFGGVGVGLLNMYIFLILAVFIAGLMVGRTPELLGKKIEPREVKIAALIFLLHPFLILVGTAIAAHLQSVADRGWLANPGFHGFSEMLYEFTSSSANNGSGFEGLADNTPFWNIACGVIMLIARFLPIIGPVAIAGFLAAKKHVPESAGTLRLDTTAFGTVLLFVILILSALAFFPALALGPIAEHLSVN
jgi:potassium-transporting ATPase potassium-binding subunit